MGSEEVRRSAALIRQLGDEVRRLADRTLAAAEVQWQSTAALGFRQRLADELVRVRAAAGDLDGAAEALSRHAGALDGGHDPGRLDPGGLDPGGLGLGGLDLGGLGLGRFGLGGLGLGGAR
jgi:hypothetical protein